MELEVVDQLEFAAQGAHELVAPVVVGGTGQVRDRVHHFIIGTARDHVHAPVRVREKLLARVDALVGGDVRILGVDAQDRGQGEGGAQRGTPLGVLRNALGGDLCVGKLVRQDQAVQEVPLIRLVPQGVARVGTEGETVVVGPVEIAAHDTFLVGVAEGKIVVHCLGSAAHGDFVGLLRGVEVEHFLLPVGALAVAERVGVAGGVAAVDEAFVDHQRIFAGIEDLTHLPGVGDTVREIVIHVRLPLDALLRRHEDHAIGGAGAVHGAGGRIFQNFDRLDVRRVQVVDAAGDGHAVHDVDRVGGVDGADAADADPRRGARLAGGGGDRHAGGEALEGVVHARRRGDGEGFGVHFGDGGRHDALLLDAVADHHGLFQHLGVVLEDDRHGLVGGNADGLAHVADAGDFRDGALRGPEDEFTVQTRHGTVVGALLDDESAHDRLPGGVLDDTPEGDVLRQGRQAHSQCKD